MKDVIDKIVRCAEELLSEDWALERGNATGFQVRLSMDVPEVVAVLTINLDSDGKILSGHSDIL